MLKVENWGRRKLAYEVKKQLKGIYLFFNYLGTAGLVEEVERNLRLLRHRASATTRSRSPRTSIRRAAPPRSPTRRSRRRAVPGSRRGGHRDRPGRLRALFGDEEEEGAFDFEEAVFGSVDEPSAEKKE